MNETSRRAAARAIAVDRDLTHTALRVLAYLVSLLDDEDPKSIVPKTIAYELGIKTDEVNGAVRQLRIKGILTQIREGDGKRFFFNSAYGMQSESAAQASLPKRETITVEQELLAGGAPSLFDI
jgi:hypothetical protein